MTDHRTADDLRQWIVDYLVETLGVQRSDVDPSAPLVDLGVGSKDAVVMAGELAEFAGKQLSPVDFWEHPTIEQLVMHLTGGGSGLPAESSTADAAARADGPIAVVGIGCRLPGGIAGPDELWQLLESGNDVIGEVPPGRWSPWYGRSDADDQLLDRITRTGGFLDGITGFDADFFDVSAREAAAMDPQQRILLEVAWEALENAGITPATLGRTATGVFVGACASEYGYLAASELRSIDAWSNTGAALSIIANRLSYLLDLRGPSMTIDTACSSSLVALHLAAQSLQRGECDTALVGGVNLLLSPALFHGFDESGALSPTGTCRAFDADADGFVRGEGCGVVVLKRLADAERDDDHIRAVIRGSAVNQDGRSNGLFAPNPAAQMTVLRAAYAAAAINPRDVDYVEAHGTGTPLGDPIEARALGNVLGRGRRADAPLLIGSVKGNVGHLEGAAGITGLIKAVLALEHATIPATPQYRDPNPHIPFDQLRLTVAAESTAWPQVGRPRRAGVSSFGFGGTNAHVVLEQAPAHPPAPSPPSPQESVTTLHLSAAGEDRITDWAERLAGWLEDAPAAVTLADTAAALRRRPGQPVRAAVVARDRAAAVAGLRALAGGPAHPASTPVITDRRSTGTVFVYCGQGAHWTAMAQRLLADDDAFAAAVDDLEPQFGTHTGMSLRAAIADGNPLTGDAQVQPVLVGIQLALTRALRAHGVTPDAVIGHSVGEVTAAVVAGALTTAEGLRVVSERSRLMAGLSGSGGVALIGASAARAAELIAGRPGVEIAVLASATQTSIAGPTDAVDAVIADAVAQNVFARRVDMDVASHTALMEPITEPLARALADLTPTPPRIPFYSTVQDTTAPHVDAAYWSANLRNPVQLHRAVAAAAADHSTFVEIGPHPVLAHALSETLSDEHLLVSTLSRDQDDTVALHRALAVLRPPAPLDSPRRGGASLSLPNTPWRHVDHWLPTGAGGRTRTPAAAFDDAVPHDWQYRLEWTPAPPALDPEPGTDRWTVIGDGPAARDLAEALSSATEPIPVAAFTGADGAPGDAVMAALLTADRVVYAPSAENDPFDHRRGYHEFAVARAILIALVAGEGGRLHIVTHNAQALRAGDRSDPAHAALWGLGRSLALEHPQVFGGLLDTDVAVAPRIVARYLQAQAHARDDEDQLVYRAGVRHVPRLRPGRAPSDPTAPDMSGFDTAGTHLVVGATGNLGPTLLRELARLGVRTLVAVSRDPRGRLDALVEELRSVGTELVVLAADAADRSAMEPVFRRFGSDLPPLAGIHLAAFGGAPVTLSQMTDDDVTAMFGPKLDAAAVLHELSRDTDLKHFMCFTSISGLTGSRWLGHYAATTTYLDAFAYARRAAGLPATVVNWGLWRSLDDAQDEAIRETTSGSGLVPMDDAVAIGAIGAAMSAGAAVQSVVVAADWPRLAAAYRIRASLKMVDDLTSEATTAVADTHTELRTRLREVQPGDRVEILDEAVAAVVAAALGLDSTDLLDRGAGFFQAGMDSLTVVTVARTLSQLLGEELPTSVVFDYPSADALTGYLRTVLPELADADAAQADEYDDYSEDELLAQLAERLN